MKSFTLTAVLAAGMILSNAQQARATEIQAADLSLAIVHDIQVTALDLINWKVGDTANYTLSLGTFGNGTMVKSVTSDEGRAIWMSEDADVMGQKQLVEVLISKDSGQILKMKQNGQEVAVPNDKIEIISQDVTEITVAAGKFKCVHIVAKSKQVSKIEVWANPQATVMDGALKQIMATQFGVDITLELQNFKHGQ